MEEVLTLIGQLRGKGWTLSAIADEINYSRDALERWLLGKNPPGNPKLVAAALRDLLSRKRIPKQRRYAKKGEA